MATGREKAIFLEALDISDAEARADFLSAVCGGDWQLRRVIDELLAAHERSGLLSDDTLVPVDRLRRQLHDAAAVLGLQTGASAVASHTDLPDDRIGEVIGSYRLMERLGEGGFGRVYVAEQQHPVRRRVALKLLKPGMDSREVIARFEAERQALALMDHPHIAQVFDAGTTNAGQPYFVMELVRGVPITEFCEQQELKVRERLELFIDVCRAVQHAHVKGVIHRDLKPSNVLVTLHDATPVAKVIDFGVAKAMREPLTDKTVYTRFAQMIGTPLYMSPEQAEMNGLDVDTRSDIYSLGVLMYELLTGTTPFDQRRLSTASFDELRRIIREEDPPRPSARISTSAAKGSTQRDNRGRDSRTVAGSLRGELDWVVMKALEKDRRRRYETAADLARDVERYLRDQPVVARPPSNWYRFSKFVRRNKVAFTTVTLVLLSLITGTAVSTWQAIRATRLQAVAETLRQEALDFVERLKSANVLLDSARANADEERWREAFDQYTQATQLQPDHYLTWSGRGSLYARLGAWRSAASDYAHALRLGASANNPAWWGVPHLCVFAGDAESYARICSDLRQQLDEIDDPAQVTFAARSLCLQPIDRETARALASRLDSLPEHQPHRGGPGPAPGSPGQFGAGPPGGGLPPRGRPDDRPRGRPDGRGEPRGDGRYLPPGGEFPGPPGDFRPPPGRGPGLAGEFQRYAAALALWRAGETAEAQRRLRSIVNSNPGSPAARLALPVLAMAYQQSGQHAEAQQSLREALRELDDWTAQLATESPPSWPVPWFDYLELVLLYREAYQQIHDEPAPDDPRISALEPQALSQLRGE